MAEYLQEGSEKVQAKQFTVITTIEPLKWAQYSVRYFHVAIGVYRNDWKCLKIIESIVIEIPLTHGQIILQT